MYIYNYIYYKKYDKHLSFFDNVDINEKFYSEFRFNNLTIRISEYSDHLKLSIGYLAFYYIRFVYNNIARSTTFTSLCLIYRMRLLLIKGKYVHFIKEHAGPSRIGIITGKTLIIYQII